MKTLYAITIAIVLSTLARADVFVVDVASSNIIRRAASVTVSGTTLTFPDGRIKGANLANLKLVSGTAPAGATTYAQISGRAVLTPATEERNAKLETIRDVIEAVVKAHNAKCPAGERITLADVTAQLQSAP